MFFDNAKDGKYASYQGVWNGMDELLHRMKECETNFKITQNLVIKIQGQMRQECSKKGISGGNLGNLKSKNPTKQLSINIVEEAYFYEYDDIQKHLLNLFKSCNRVKTTVGFLIDDVREKEKDKKNTKLNRKNFSNELQLELWEELKKVKAVA